MPSKRRRYESSDDESSFSSSESSSDSEYRSKHKRKKKKSKHRKSKSKRKHKESKRRRKKHKKDKEFKHKRKSISKSKRKHHKDDFNHNNEPAHKKRKLSKANPCASKEMISNAKTVVSMFCENDSIKEYMESIFYKLDNNQSICLSNEDISYQQPLKMIFTFLSLQTEDNITYKKANNQSIPLQSIFKKELKVTTKPKNNNASPKPIIGPSLPPPNFKKSKPTIPSRELLEIKSSDIIGVTMPTRTDLENNQYASSEDGDGADLYGPAALNQDGVENESERVKQMLRAKIINELNKKIEGDGNVNKNNNVREEWLTTMPESFMTDLEKGTKARGFNLKEQGKMDKTWTETPSDLKRQKRERKRIKQIHRETNEKLKALGLPIVSRKREESKENVCDDEDVVNEVVEQRKSLFEIHQETLMEEYEEALKKWKKKKKMGQKVGPKPVYKGAKKYEGRNQYQGSMESFYNPSNPTLTRSKLNTFVSGGTIEDY